MNFIQHSRSALLSLAGVVFLAARSLGDSVTLQPSADTSLFAFNPDNNLGGTGNLLVGVNGTGFPGRGLVRFEVAGRIPAGAMIQSATLTVKVIIVPAGGGVSSVFEVRRALRDWGEGVGTGNTGSAANNGEATWNNRFHPSTPWSVPGGAVSNDFSGTISASMLIGDIGSYTFSSTNLVTDLQQWLSNPGTNFGWVLISQLEDTAFTARRLGSRESAGNEPTLTIQYTVPVVPNIQWIKIVNGQIQFSFLAQAGQSYTIQSRDSLASGNWQTFTNVGPQLVTTNLLVVDSFTTNPQRFYRVAY